MGRSTASTSAASLVLAALVCVPGASRGAAVPLAADDPVRILLVGDSITQGSAGDWTWRYRLWQHLTASGVEFDLVGGRHDLRDEISHTFGNEDYVDPVFDQDHAARWGMRLSALDEPIDELVADYAPDVLVTMLGDNDLTAGSTAQETAQLLSGLVADARSADPGLDIVLATDPRPTYQPAAADYNVEVRELTETLDTPASPVVLADAAAGYDDTVDTYDGSHPNARGELKIAAAVSDALQELEIAPAMSRPLPALPLGPRIPPALTATATVSGAELSWVRSPGSQESQVWTRDVTADQSWQLVAEHVTGLGHQVTGLVPGHVVELQTRPLKGFWVAQQDAWSNVVRIEVPDDPPGAASRPVLVASADGRVRASWAAVPRATSYAVQWRRADSPGSWVEVEVAGTAATIDGLIGRTGYAVRVRGLRDGAPPGPFSPEETIRVPALPGVPGVQAVRSRRGLRTTAQPVPFATSYTLHMAPAARCRRMPGDGRFAVVASGLTRLSKRLRPDTRAAWVRWTASRDGVDGEVGPTSTACVRLPRRQDRTDGGGDQRVRRLGQKASRAGSA